MRTVRPDPCVDHFTGPRNLAPARDTDDERRGLTASEAGVSEVTVDVSIGTQLLDYVNVDRWAFVRTAQLEIL